MPLNIPPWAYQCKLRWRCVSDPDEMICTLGIVPVADWDGAPLEPGSNAGVIAQKVGNSWIKAFGAPELDSDWTFGGVEVASGLGEDGRIDAAEDPTFQPGTGDSPPVTVNVAVLVKKKTPYAGHRYQGRMYLPAGYTYPDGMNAAGDLTPTLLARLGSSLDQFQLNLQTDDAEDGPAMTMCLFHSYSDEKPDKFGPTVIRDLIAAPKVATQRRRLRK